MSQQLGMELWSNSHKVEGTVRDQEKFFICIHETFKELSHIRRRLYVLFNMVAYNVMHNRMARADGVLN